jgi:isopenicillin N synthase-like dioxygenase
VTSTQIPIVDLAAADAPRQMDRAAARFGFLQVVNHGVASELIDGALAAMQQFFALPLDVKSRYKPPSPDVNNGYSAIGDESLVYSLGVEAPPDLFEAFNLGPEHVDLSDPAVIAERHRIFHPNLWPAEAPLMREAGVAYFDAVQAAAHRVTSVCARALGLDADFFEPFTTHSTDTLRLNWYRRDAGRPEPLSGQQRMGAHTDYGIVTLLYADSVPGLEIVGPDGEWLPVIPEPGALVVNLGDLTAQWTNDRWRSTVHRVVPPSASTVGPSLRRSMAFFHDGNWDAIVECLPTCCSDEEPARYAPVRALDHLMNKLIGGRTMTVAEATDHIGDRIGTLTQA